jgi:hypothetical protein
MINDFWRCRQSDPITVPDDSMAATKSGKIQIMTGHGEPEI